MKKQSATNRIPSTLNHVALANAQGGTELPKRSKRDRADDYDPDTAPRICEDGKIVILGWI